MATVTATVMAAVKATVMAAVMVADDYCNLYRAHVMITLENTKAGN